jgi:hypothetical protein
MIGFPKDRVQVKMQTRREEILLMADEKTERAEGVSRMLTGEDAPEDTNSESLTGPTGGGGGEMAPEGAGEKVEGVTGGESMIEKDGKEPGRQDAGTQGPTNRPVGTSTARDSSGVDPQESVTDSSTAPTGMGSAS